MVAPNRKILVATVIIIAGLLGYGLRGAVGQTKSGQDMAMVNSLSTDLHLTHFDVTNLNVTNTIKGMIKNTSNHALIIEDIQFDFIDPNGVLITTQDQNFGKDGAVLNHDQQTEFWTVTMVPQSVPDYAKVEVFINYK